jgi:hypothetical protein
MAFGHNSNVTVAGATYHVQTEERGPAHGLIDTTVYFRGQVLHRRTHGFHDLLPLNAQREEALRVRVEKQHHGVIEEIRSGKLTLALPPEQEKAPAPSAPAITEKASLLHLELLNAKSWLSGKRALLQIVVRDRADQPVEHAMVTARVEGASRPTMFSAESGPFGHAQFEFELPQVAGSEVALVIEASKGKAQAQLRFQLRAKPKRPSAV